MASARSLMVMEGVEEGLEPGVRRGTAVNGFAEGV